jgi:outer membrane protein TolC
VLDAQVALTEARTNVLQANYRYATAIARVRRAIGSADPFVLSATR